MGEGGESGPGARPMEESWVLEIRDQCEAAGVKFFFKQWGGTNKKKAGRILDGRTYDAMRRRRARKRRKAKGSCAHRDQSLRSHIATLKQL